MIQYKLLSQYTRVVNGLRFPQSLDEPYLLVYFSENSTLLYDYPKLNIRKMDARFVIVPVTKMPVTRLTPELRAGYKKLGLIPYNSNMAFPKNKNLIVDTTAYTNKIDEVYKPTTYRQRAGSLIQNYLFNTFQLFPPNYKKILIYSTDTTQQANEFLNKKIFLMLQQMKADTFPFDDMLLATLDNESVKYRLLVKDKEFAFPRVYQYIRKIKINPTEEEAEEELNSATNKVMKLVSTDVAKPDLIKNAVKSYLIKYPGKVEKIDNNELSADDMKRLTAASIFYHVSGDIDKANRLTKTLPTKSLNKSVARISAQYEDDLLQPHKAVNSSVSYVSQLQEPVGRVDNKTPGHIFDKRRIDFETNLRKDMSNAFKVLERRDIPLKFDSISITDVKQRAGELSKSDEALVAIKMKDDQGRVHDVNLIIPRIDPDTGTFRVNGRKKCLINQIVLNPISFPKPYDSKFESSYSHFHIYSKRTIRLKYLEIYMGASKLPLLIMLSYAFGFEKSLNQYGVGYKIVTEKPGKDEHFAKYKDKYIVFTKVDSEVKEELTSSFINANIDSYDLEGEFLSKQFFNDLIIKITGRIDSTYLIDNNIDNIVDPVVRQVLINQQLPFELPLIMQYMSTKCVTGFVQDRNDLTNQRIRNSELLVHLAQKQLLKSYTEYREQYLSGNKDAQLVVPEKTVLTQFSQLEIVQDMEYANPFEEMATITKVSPVGKTVGGIPDKQAVQLDARNVHPSYFGNIDPVDTAEGGNIGITQQLTVNAYITSARGLFGQKPLDDNEKSGILSTSASMVPFVENNEGARIIMSTNQAKQMLPLKNPEPPIIQTGYESMLTSLLSDSYIKKSPCNGVIKSITNDYIDIICNDNKLNRIDITPVQLKSGMGRNTLSTFKPLVNVNQKVKFKQIIAEGSGISGGTISMGRNLAACYMPYKGYNFEDGIVISERLVTQEQLTSLHGMDVEIFVDKKDRIISIIEMGKTTLKGEPLFRKVPGEIDELLGYEQSDEDDVDIADGQIIIKSPGGKVVDIEVYSNIDISSFPMLKELSNRTNKKNKKPEKEKYTDRGIAVKGIKIVFKIEQELTIGLGDKLCNRFGNKGIISLIEKEENMPRTPWGERTDIVFSPLGVIARMNMGQIYELYCGLISKHVSRIIAKTKSKAEAINLLATVMNSLDTTPGNKFAKDFIGNINKLNDVQFKQMVSQISNAGYFPIIIPPFQAPTYKHILPLLKKLGLQASYHMTLPEFGTKTANPVAFGYLYMAKLEHIGEMKAHARSTGPMVSKTLQPTGGKSREGGQRMGEGDTWALASYNCPTLLAEFFGPLSDDVSAKNEMLTDIIQTGTTNFKQSKASPTKDLLNAYFVSMMLGT